MWKSTKATGMGAVVALAMFAAVPAAASASFVGPSVGGSGTSCNHTGYAKISEAITKETAGGTITICPGTYNEQLVIEKELTLAGRGHPVIALPGSPKPTVSGCDSAVNATTGGEDQDLVSICTDKTVTVKGITFEAKWPEGTCNDSLYGIMVLGGATLDASKILINGAGAYPINGCQGGLGIEAGWGYGIDEPGHLVLEKSRVENYQKNGITVDGAGSTATITNVYEQGAGPTAQGQNGVQISRGATATISKAEVVANECNIAHVCGSSSSVEWAEDASGILFYEPGTGSTVSESKLAENNIGVEYVSAEPPAKSNITLSGDKIKGGYASVQVNQGSATLTEDKFSEALIGLDVNAYGYGDDSYGPTITSSESKISGTDAAVQVESSLAGTAGSLSLSGGRVRGFINNYDPEFVITG